MDTISRKFGTINRDAPAELSQFAFLLGDWRCEARILLATGEWQSFDAAWSGRFILDGYALADEYRMTDKSGKVIVLGMNVRAYDPVKGAWKIKWLSGLSGTWTDLGSEELGGVRVEGSAIHYILKEPMSGHAYTRATYTVHSAEHFTWRGESSEDMTAWSEFMVVEAYRIDTL